MANNRMTEGVGKKIVEALKMQTEDNEMDSSAEFLSDNADMADSDLSASDDLNFTEDVDDENSSQDFVSNTDETSMEEDFEQSIDLQNNASFTNLNPAISNFGGTQDFEASQVFDIPAQKNIPQDINNFEVPSNIAVLKQLIAKLPAGVTKQTGALIIKQTMEALGISMRSVLQEAQQVQEGLNNSSRECQASIAEYKKQIGVLEKQAQKYQRQYSALNDIISLFVQTNY